MGVWTRGVSRGGNSSRGVLEMAGPPEVCRKYPRVIRIALENVFSHSF